MPFTEQFNDKRIGRLRRENHYNGGAIMVPSHEFEAYLGNVGLKVLRGSRVPHFPIPPKRSQAKIDLGQGKWVAKVCIKRRLVTAVTAWAGQKGNMGAKSISVLFVFWGVNPSQRTI